MLQCITGRVYYCVNGFFVSHDVTCLLHIRIVSYGGYAFFQAHKNLKLIYLTFGYVGVAHWAATDGRPQRCT